MSSILVVDDEAAMREFYRRALTADGYRPVEARTAEEALDYLAMTPDIALVVVDLNMPGNGGAWLIEQMRQRFPDVAVILSTADQRVPGTLSLRASVINYLVKPVSAKHLLDAVHDALAAPQSPASAALDTADPIEDFLNRKLTHRHGDGEPKK
jgi:two-component system, NtrC family, nitrogen regulation response regulator NtrX